MVNWRQRSEDSTEGSGAIRPRRTTPVMRDNSAPYSPPRFRLKNEPPFRTADPVATDVDVQFIQDRTAATAIRNERIHETTQACHRWHGGTRTLRHAA